MAEATALDLQRFLAAVGASRAQTTSVAEPTPAIVGRLEDAIESATDSDRFATALAALIWNVDPSPTGRLAGGKIAELVLDIDRRVAAQLDEILHDPSFQAMEAAWRGLDELVRASNFRANIGIDFLDASKDEIFDDFEAGSADITATALFRKAYVEEFDQFGGKPYGAIVGLYDFACTPKDLFWLRQVSKVAAVAHAPFIGAVSPKFFGFDDAEQLASARDLAGLLQQQRFAPWHALRESPEAVYVALTLPRYLVRAPWTPDREPRCELDYVEDVGPDGRGWLWGSAAIPFARVLLRAFERSGWCQNIRGPKGGGLVSGLVAPPFRLGAEVLRKPPVEVAIPDWAELGFANAGFIPLIAKPDSDEACFFSCQSVKAPKRYKSQVDTERSQLHTNLAYTLSAARIAHYLKCIVRDNVGTTADAPYVQRRIKRWLEGYVTTIANPDDKTLRFYPFRSARVAVEPAEGLVGKYNCLVAVAPHIQFEGIDVELRLESRLG